MSELPDLLLHFDQQLTACIQHHEASSALLKLVTHLSPLLEVKHIVLKSLWQSQRILAATITAHNDSCFCLCSAGMRTQQPGSSIRSTGGRPVCRSVKDASWKLLKQLAGPLTLHGLPKVPHQMHLFIRNSANLTQTHTKSADFRHLQETLCRCNLCYRLCC